jgi:hypothetical protein
MAKVFTAIGEVVTYGTPIVIVITLVVQIIAKKVITSMWVFYSALQLAILICKNSNIQNSASVVTMVNLLDGIINLSSLDKSVILD